MDLYHHILNVAPEIALFIALTLGYALGQVKFGRFSLGGIAGSLLVALVIGLMTGVVLPAALKSVCFALFIYAVGFKSGPEFFGGLNRDSLKLVLSATVQCVTGLLLVLLFARLFGFGKGFAAGIGAGALTETAMMGTASDALTRLGLSPEDFAHRSGEMAVGFAMTYVFGTVGVILFVRSVAPRMLGVNVQEAARALELELSEGRKVSRPGYVTSYVPVVSRAYEVTAKKAAGRTVAALEQEFERVTIERIIRHEEVVAHDAGFVLEDGDLVGVTGRLTAVVAAGELIGDEVESKEALSFPIKVVTVVVKDKRIAGQTLRQLRALLDKDAREGVHLLGISRQDLPVPILLKTQVRRGDILELAGRAADVDRVAAALGSTAMAGDKSDLAYHALAIAAGTLLGFVTVPVAGIPLTLGIGGGVLVSGLCFGWWHMRNPIRGALPGPAQWVLSEFGLSAFAAVVGLSAGPTAVEAIRQQGVALLLGGAVVTIVPPFVALLVGRFLLKLNPVILLGALCGGQTVAAALNAVTDETQSMTPVLGFTVTYAVANVLLAIWGPVIVALA